MAGMSIEDAYSSTPKGMSIDDAYGTSQKSIDDQFAADVADRKAVGRQIAQGALFGFSDEIIGAARAGWEKLSGGSRTYSELRDEERAALEEYVKANPKMATALELAGGVAMPGLGAARVAANVARATGSRILGLGTAGAGYGTVQGAGEAEELSDIPLEAGKHGAMGAAAGPVLGRTIDGAVAGARALYDGASSAARFVGDASSKFMPWQGAANRYAERAGVEQMNRSGIETARQFDTANMAAMSDVPMVPTNAMDVGGDRVAQLAREAIPSSGNGTGVARGLVEQQGRDASVPMQRFNDARFGIHPHETDTIRLNELERMRAQGDYAAIQPQLDTALVQAPELLRVLETRPHARAAWEGGQTNWHNREGRLLTADEIALQRQVPNSFISGPNGQLIPHMEPTEVPLGLLDDMLKASSQRMENLNKPGVLDVNGEGTYASQQAHTALVDAVRRVDARHGTDLTGTRQRYSEALEPSGARERGMQAFSSQQGEKLGDQIRHYDGLTPERQRDFAVGYLDALRRAMTESGDHGFNVASLFRSVEHRELFDRVMRHAGAGDQIRNMMETMAARNTRNRDLLAVAERRPVVQSGDSLSQLGETVLLGQVAPIAGVRGMFRGVTSPWTERRANAMTELLMTTGGRDRLRDAVGRTEQSRIDQTARRGFKKNVYDAMVQSLIAQNAGDVDDAVGW